MSAPIPELTAVGLNFPKWQDALESAYGSGRLGVAGEVREGQVLQFDDPSGARLVILTAEPYATFASFTGGSEASGHLSMVNDVIGVIDVVDDSPLLQVTGQSAPTVASLTATIAQGPMIADDDALEYQRLQISALATGVDVYTDPAFFAQVTGGEARVGSVESHGLADINSATITPHAAATITVETTSVVKRTNELTGQTFWLARVRSPFEFSVILPESVGDLAAASVGDDGRVRPIILAGQVQFTATLVEAAGCDGGGCGSDGCGCGGH